MSESEPKQEQSVEDAGQQIRELKQRLAAGEHEHKHEHEQLDTDTSITPPASRPPDTGVAVRATHCPHCGWDLAVKSDVEPSDTVKQAFLMSVLGLKPYYQEFSELGGHLTLTFRTLTSRELDAIYRRAYEERNSGKLTTEMDFWEYLNRMRAALQLVSVHTAGHELIELPEGLTPTTNSKAKTHWHESDASAAVTAAYDRVYDEILSTESLTRIVYQKCGQFNRVVAKLEAMTSNPDFWPAIGSHR